MRRTARAGANDVRPGGGPRIAAYDPDVNRGFPKLPLPLGFAGGLWDKDTGLAHFGHRDYDPDVGRFTTKDPIGYAGGDRDLYGYCLDDPVNGVGA